MGNHILGVENRLPSVPIQKNLAAKQDWLPQNISFPCESIGCLIKSHLVSNISHGLFWFPMSCKSCTIALQSSQGQINVSPLIIAHHWTGPHHCLWAASLRRFYFSSLVFNLNWIISLYYSTLACVHSIIISATNQQHLDSCGPWEDFPLFLIQAKLSLPVGEGWSFFRNKGTISEHI